MIDARAPVPGETGGEPPDPAALARDAIRDVQAFLAGRAAGPGEPPAGAPAAPGGPRRPAHLTDLGNAFLLVRDHGDDLRHVAGWGWLAWDGRRWARDQKPVTNMAKAVALGLHAGAQALLAEARAQQGAAQAAAARGDRGAEAAAAEEVRALQGRAAALAAWAKASQACCRIEAAVRLAASEPAVSAAVADFDRDPWLLPCANGTLDLRTGALRAHAREDLLTGLSPAPYEPQAACPGWEAFLARIMAGNAALTGFLQRAVGYSLTGCTREEVVFLLHGRGANGKSTFLRTVQALLGPDYARQAAPGLLTDGRDPHPTALADLAGARFVASGELDDGRRLAEALIKWLTGGDPLKARWMRQDYFQFEPTFKFWLASNRRPAIRDAEEAMWRRIRLVPFAVTIPEGERDPHLGARLREELPGILAWAVRGCLAWQREGLGVPEAVAAATADYRADSDHLGRFLDECTERDEHAQEQARPLYLAYARWAEENGLPERERQSSVRFAESLQGRGFERYRDSVSGVMRYAGLRVRGSS